MFKIFFKVMCDVSYSGDVLYRNVTDYNGNAEVVSCCRKPFSRFSLSKFEKLLV